MLQCSVIVCFDFAIHLFLSSWEMSCYWHEKKRQRQYSAKKQKQKTEGSFLFVKMILHMGLYEILQILVQTSHWQSVTFNPNLLSFD